MKWFLKVLRQYADFSGRARRKEYWMYSLINFIFVTVASILDNATGMAIEGIGYGPIYIIFVLATLIPGIAVSVRRLHDVGKSGWMLFVALIPIIGVIWLLVLAVKDSQPGSNQYGENPKSIEDGELLDN
jgi:uncharacterized membrane protein YhaH (DUF805 family)